MISFLRGRVAAVSGQSAVIDVGGVGVSTLCTPATLARLRTGEEAELATSLVVREESLTLYGFTDGEEREAFEVLQTASGVGPRLALAALAVLTPEALGRAVAAEDTAVLTRVPGIGTKGAQRICLELRDKLGSAYAGAPAGAPAAPEAPAGRGQAVEGLVNLGWPARDAEAAVQAVAAELPDAEAGQADASVLLRSALRRLSRA